jgi:glycerol-3-phosphate O-acyltransferase
MNRAPDPMDKTAEAVGIFLKKTFSTLHYDGPDLDTREISEISLMPVCTHRSQTDYFILGEFLHRVGIRRVRYAAGDNLTELPILGPKFRQWGAFSVHRSRASRKTYLRNLCEQVVDMLGAGDNVVVFPEGGRSYSGHMMEMRNGLIGACVLAQSRNPNDDYAFLPLAISYEVLPELLYFDMLNKGKKIRSSGSNFFRKLQGSMYYYGADIIAFSKFMIANRIHKNYGEVFIDYGEPLPINAIVNLQSDLDAHGRDDFSALRPSINKAGAALHKKLLQLYRILPMHVVAHLLHQNDNRLHDESHLVNQAAQAVADLKNKERNVKSLVSLDGKSLVEKGIAQLIRHKAVSMSRGRVSIRNSSVIRYFAASIQPE